MDLAPENLRRALAGDAEAVRWLVDHLTPVVQARVARALLRRAHASGHRCARQEVEDLAQEVFVALFENGGKVLRTWDPERGLSLANFAGLVAERVAASILRSGRRSPWTEDPTLAEGLDQPSAEAMGPERRVASQEMLAVILDGVRARLSPKGLDLFERLLVRQQDVDAVCAETGLSREAVHAWRSRLGKLVRALAEDALAEKDVSGLAGSPRRTKIGGAA